MNLEFGIRLPVSGPFAGIENILRVAQQAEILGYDSVWVHDHIIWSSESHRKHVASGSVEAVTDSQEPVFLEALTSLSYLAALTTKVKLGTAVLILPSRNPIIVAKEIANIDVLSRGRMILGVGVGGRSSTRGQLETLGVPLRARGGLTDEYIHAMRELWASPVSSFQGKYVKFTDIEMFPKPIQNTGPPIWIGGTSRAAVTRAARLGDGWIPDLLSPSETIEKSILLRDMMTQFGRGNKKFVLASDIYTSIAAKPEEARKTASETILTRLHGRGSFQELEPKFLVGSPDELITKIGEYADAGVTHFDLKFIYPSVDKLVQMMELFSDQVAPSFR
ncbi:MAG: LLM class flavin-dependent oxidoreductase [Thaumarchaeota archaeon]|nr:LLM class flavin-dependent oxidoreductase [Nitrososphaerota archaeon]